jgi:hypothetical protein
VAGEQEGCGWLAELSSRLGLFVGTPPGASWALITSVALFCSGFPASAQSFSIDWYSIDGGGGTSSGGGYSLSGTIGQADTGVMSGGNFTLQGGFWSLAVILPTPGGPRLSVMQNGQVLKIAWAKPADGWVLESTPALSGPSTQWTQVTQTYQDDGASYSATFNAFSGRLFLRLHKP